MEKDEEFWGPLLKAQQEWEEWTSVKRFTEEEVKNLNSYQFIDQAFHPFTCPKDHSEHICLVATEHGWVCPAQTCDYTQDWAHDFMKSKRHKNPLDLLSEE